MPSFSATSTQERREQIRYIGVDLHKTNLVVCFLPARGPQRIAIFDFADDGLVAFRCQLRPDDEVAVEVGQNTHYFLHQIQDRVKRVVLVDPHRFAVISRSKKKTPNSLFIQELKRVCPEARAQQRNAVQETIDWRFTITDAREKLKRLYPPKSLR